MAATPPNSAIICIKCGYQLRSLPSNICPECGRSFDPKDPSTFLTEGYRSHFARKVTTPPGKPLLASTIIAAAMGVIALSAPTGGNLMFFLAAAAFAICTIIWWSFRILLAIGYVVAKRAPKSGLTISWRRWVILPLVFGLVLVLAATQVLVRVRFELSRHQLEAAARRSAGESDQIVYDHMIGLYHIGRGRLLADGSVELTLPTYGFFSATSFLYAPGNKPRMYPGDQVIEITKGWYVRVQD